MSNKRINKAFVRFDGSGRIVPSSLILQKSKPKVGDWHEIDAYECCNPTTTTTSTTTSVPTTTTTTTPPPTTTSTTTPVPPAITATVEDRLAAAPTTGTSIVWTVPTTIFNDAGQQGTVTVQASADCGILVFVNAAASQLQIEYNLLVNGVLQETLPGGAISNRRVDVLSGDTVSIVTVIPGFFSLNAGTTFGSFSTTLVP